MVWLLRHRQTKGPATDRLHLHHRATSRLHKSLTSFPIFVGNSTPITSLSDTGNYYGPYLDVCNLMDSRKEVASTRRKTKRGKSNRAKTKLGLPDLKLICEGRAPGFVTTQVLNWSRFNSSLATSRYRRQRNT